MASLIASPGHSDVASPGTVPRVPGMSHVGRVLFSLINIASPAFPVTEENQVELRDWAARALGQLGRPDEGSLKWVQGVLPMTFLPLLPLATW